jgi:hypothetical protein
MESEVPEGYPDFSDRLMRLCWVGSDVLDGEARGLIFARVNVS